MLPRRLRLFLLLSIGLFAASGANCQHNLYQPAAAALPRQLPLAPSLDQVIQVVNRNNSQIQTFSTDAATISVPGNPRLKASLAFQRPNFFRMKANFSLTGREVDVGSNPDFFWYWLRQANPPAIYYCRHDQFATSPARQSIPIQPGWLIEALGVTELDPSLPNQGPFPLAGDRLEIRTLRDTPDGPVTKVTIVNGSQGWILEQNIYDAQNRLLASAVASEHRRDPLSGLVMPGVVVVNCPPAQFQMRIDLGAVQINRLNNAPPELWNIPSIPNTPVVNLAAPVSPPLADRR